MPVEQANVKWWGRTPLREERTKPSETCPNPERWTAIDDVTAELEVLKFIRSLVRTVKPLKAVTVGDPSGELSRYIGQAIRENGCGHLTVCGIDPKNFDQVLSRIIGSGLSRYVTVLEDGARDTGGELDFVVIAGGEQVKKDAVQFTDLLADRGMLLAHGVRSLQWHDGTAMGDDPDVISLPTPRGLVIVRK